MRTIFAAIALGLFSGTVLAQSSMDTNESSLGDSLGSIADEAHLEEHGC